MKVTTALKNKIETIKSLKENYGISCREYPDRYVLNYSQIDSYNYLFHPFVRECRQLILNKNFDVLHRSFDRFYNYHEDPNSSIFDFLKCEIEEKLDGSIIGIYYDGKQWCISTRTTAFAELNIDQSNESFYNIITENIDLTNFYKSANKLYSYIFEFVSPFNRIVKRYPHCKLILLAVRNKITGEYLNREIEGKFCGVTDFPIVYNFKTIDEINNSMLNLNKEDEGYVCRIGDWRIKIKNPEFLKIFAFRCNGTFRTKKLINIVHNYEESEYLSYFPEDKILFQPYINIRENLENYYQEIFKTFKDIETDAEFAKKTDHITGQNILFIMRRKNLPVKEILKKLREQTIHSIYNNLYSVFNK